MDIMSQFFRPRVADVSGTPFAYDDRSWVQRAIGVPPPSSTIDPAAAPGPQWTLTAGGAGVRSDSQDEEWQTNPSSPFYVPPPTRMQQFASRIPEAVAMGMGATRMPLPPVNSSQAMMAARRGGGVGINKEPPSAPARPFEVDYPSGASADATGRLTRDIDGRPIHPDAFIVGRRNLGGPDEALPSTQAAVDAITERLFGTRPQSVARGQIAHRSDGQASIRPGSDRTEYNFFVADDLSPAAKTIVSRHELGHGIDYAAAGRSGIPLDGIKKQGNAAYNDMNNPLRHHVRAKPESNVRPKYHLTPEANGYTRSDAAGEITADAVSWYLANPSSMKQYNPALAHRIREYVNTSPVLRDKLHLNSFAAPAAAAAGTEFSGDIFDPYGRAYR